MNKGISLLWMGHFFAVKGFNYFASLLFDGL